MPGKTKPPAWVLRWLGPFGVTYIGDDPEMRRAKDYRRKIVHKVADATLYPTREAAESAALFLIGKHPEELIGRIVPRLWDGRKKYP